MTPGLTTLSMDCLGRGSPRGIMGQERGLDPTATKNVKTMVGSTLGVEIIAIMELFNRLCVFVGAHYRLAS